MPCRFKTLARAFEATGVLRHAPGQKLGRGLIAVAALAATVTAAAPALADYGSARVSELDQATIKVASDGERYTTVLNSSPAITGVMKMTLNAHRDGRVKEWELWPSIEAENMEEKQFPELNHSKSYPVGKRHKVVRRELPFSIPRQAYKAYAEEACNELAKDLQLLHSKTNAEIFAEDRSIAIQVDAEVTWEMSGIVEANPPRAVVTGTGGPNPNIKPVTILCMKTPPAPPAVIGAAVVVSGIDPVNSQGECRMQLNGSLVSNVPNLDVSFRYVDDKGNQSDLKTVNTGSDRSVSFEHSYPLSPGQKSTKIRIVGQNPTFTSAWKDFDYECEEGSVGDFATLLPPTAGTLSHVVKKYGVYKGKVCPSVITVIGRIDGRGKSAGKITLRADGTNIAEKPFSIIGDESKVFTGEHRVVWQGKPAMQQDIALTLHVYGQKPPDGDIGNVAAAAPEIPIHGPLQDELQKTVSLNCVDVEQPDQFVSNDSTPPVPSFNPTPVGQKMHQGYVCPAEIALDAQLLGKDPFEGRVVLIAKQQPSLFESQSQVKEFDFTIAKNQYQGFPFRPEVRWSNVPDSGDLPPKQTMDLSFQVVKTGGVVASVERSLEVSCKAVNVAGTAISYDPPKILGLTVASTTDEVLHQGRICPARVRLTGVFTGQGVASGNVVLGANGGALTQEPYSIEDGVTETIRGEYNLNWVGVQGPFQQDVEFVLRLNNAEGGEVDALTKNQTFACRKPELARGDTDRVDGLSTGNSSIPHSQQAGRPAAPGNGAEGQFALQTGPAFAIQAPKGRVRAGRIQLSGGPVDAKYDLRFYRGDEGGYRMVRSAQLPRQMTGRTATFNLKALSGSRTWRIEVCPAGSKSKAACKTSDFRIARIGAAGKPATPGRQAGTKVFILPGSGN